jgi:hypothetical protein
LAAGAYGLVGRTEPEPAKRFMKAALTLVKWAAILLAVLVAAVVLVVVVSFYRGLMG